MPCIENPAVGCVPEPVARGTKDLRPLINSRIFGPKGNMEETLIRLPLHRPQSDRLAPPRWPGWWDLGALEHPGAYQCSLTRFPCAAIAGVLPPPIGKHQGADVRTTTRQRSTGERPPPPCWRAPGMTQPAAVTLPAQTPREERGRLASIDLRRLAEAWDALATHAAQHAIDWPWFGQSFDNYHPELAV